MREIDRILDPNEQVLWEGKPALWPYVLTGSLPSFLFGIVWFLFLSPFLSAGLFLNVAGEGMVTASVNLFLLPFVLIGLFLLFGIPLLKILGYKNLYYAITGKRIIIQSGIIGRDFSYVDFDQIASTEVQVGFWDKTIGGGSGSIAFFAQGVGEHDRRGNFTATPHTLANIANPYDVFKFFKKLSHDVKTDIEYPNKLRPSENPGYTTEWKGEKK